MLLVHTFWASTTLISTTHGSYLINANSLFGRVICFFELLTPSSPSTRSPTASSASFSSAAQAMPPYPAAQAKDSQNSVCKQSDVLCQPFGVGSLAPFSAALTPGSSPDGSVPDAKHAVKDHGWSNPIRTSPLRAQRRRHRVQSSWPPGGARRS